MALINDVDAENSFNLHKIVIDRSSTTIPKGFEFKITYYFGEPDDPVIYSEYLFTGGNPIVKRDLNLNDGITAFYRCPEGYWCRETSISCHALLETLTDTFDRLSEEEFTFMITNPLFKR